MRFLVSSVLLLLIGAARAASKTAKVYIFQEPELSISSPIPTLSPEDARLIIAQRIGVSRYHSLSTASKDALAHINAFGGPQSQLFTDDGLDGRSQLVLLIDNITPDLTIRYEKEWAPIQPAFEISNPPSRTDNRKLVRDLDEQNPLVASQLICTAQENANPFNEECWPGKFRILHVDAITTEEAISRNLELIATMLKYVKNEAMDVMVILMPESGWTSSSPYGSYDMPARPLDTRGGQFEEPIEELETSAFDESDTSDTFRTTLRKKRVVFSTCYSEIESCQNATRNCSGHGNCVAKYGSNTNSTTDSCFTCACIPSIMEDLKRNSTKITHWGGAACQKIDISSPFWLLVSISVVLVGLVSAGIGMLFSIGEEKLPSVIGAGVSGPRAR